MLSFWLHLEIRYIWRPVAGLAGTRDSMAQVRDIPGNPGRVATLISRHITKAAGIMHVVLSNNSKVALYNTMRL